MGALPHLGFTGTRQALYVEELREFLTSADLLYGTPSDILAFNQRLRSSAQFFDQLSAHVRSILFREGGSMSRARLLEIFAVAIGGHEMEQPAQHFREPMRQLFAFVTGTMRRPGSAGSGPRSAVVRFPSDTASAEVADSAEPAGVAREEYFHSSPSEVEADLTPTTAASSIRNLVLIGAGVVALVLLLVLLLRPRARVAADSHVSLAHTSTVHRPKPSPYGEAFSPMPAAPRRHRVHTQPTTVATTTAPSSLPPAGATAQPTQ